jgi:hypothetical protein
MDNADSNSGSLLTEWQTTRRNLSRTSTLAIVEASHSGYLIGTDTDDEELAQHPQPNEQSEVFGLMDTGTLREIRDLFREQEPWSRLRHWTTR